MTYASFLIRCWRFDGGTQRVRFKIEHIQSGDDAQMTSVEDALAWLAAKLNAANEDQALPPVSADKRDGPHRWPADRGGKGGER